MAFYNIFCEKSMVKWALDTIYRNMDDERLKVLFLDLLDYYAKQTDNTIDDEIVLILKKSINK